MTRWAAISAALGFLIAAGLALLGYRIASGAVLSSSGAVRVWGRP